MNQPLGRDYRKGPLQIDWMEFEKNELAGRRPYANAGKKKEGGRGAIQNCLWNFVESQKLISF